MAQRVAFGRYHVELDDIIEHISYRWAQAQANGSSFSFDGAAIDCLRTVGGREGRKPITNLLHCQFLREPRVPESDYVVPLALKRCGVLMLDCLPERLRRVIMLRYWHGLTQKEVALEMDLSFGRISQLERDACRIIARELARRGIRSMRDVI